LLRVLVTLLALSFGGSVLSSLLWLLRILVILSCLVLVRVLVACLGNRIGSVVFAILHTRLESVPIYAVKFTIVCS
jgi:hypothetical protein